jgi:hypothetical protein
MVVHAARVPVWAARPNLRLSDFGSKKFVGRDFRRAAENRTPAACAPRATAPHSTSTSEFGFKTIPAETATSSGCATLLSAG